MREIKFRAWDKTEKVMKVFSYGIFNRMPDKFEDLSKPMQNTGLKDKNGVEIYEGDILEVEKNDDGTYKGTINGNTFFDRFQGYSSKIKVDGVHDINNIRYWNNHVGVIGNIYEDSGLIK